MSEDALLKSWREHREMLWPMENPVVVAPMFRRGWEARQSEVDGLRVEVGAMRALKNYWQELANKREGT